MISDITLLGWFHSIVGILAIASGVYSLGRYTIIDINSLLGKFYIASTSVVSEFWQPVAKLVATAVNTPPTSGV